MVCFKTLFNDYPNDYIVGVYIKYSSAAQISAWRPLGKSAVGMIIISTRRESLFGYVI